MAQPATLLPAGTRPYLTVGQVAELLGISERTVRRRIIAGELEAVQTSPQRGRIRIPRSALERFLEGCRR